MKAVKSRGVINVLTPTSVITMKGCWTACSIGVGRCVGNSVGICEGLYDGVAVVGV